MTTTSPYLLVDTVAYTHLQNEPECIIGDKNVTVKGFEAYVVEQWACERRYNSIVCSYTGNSANQVLANVLHLPTQRENWGPVVTEFMESMSQNHLLTKETPTGRMFIANLNSFPSNKTLIPMPMEFFQGLNALIVNENLKRLNCMGRLAVSLHPPPDAAKSSFYHTFAIPTEVPIAFAIREIVTLLQIGLFYCGMLEGNYVDGFLCDFTTKAIEVWWKKFGEARHGFRPLPGSSGYSQQSVAAIIGFTFGCNYRLSLLGLKPPKDCFSVHQFLQCVYNFQRHERLEKTMRLNTSTVRRLLDQTAKQLSDGPDLIASLKTTVQENLRGKIRVAVNDYETCDMKTLASHVKGTRAKYLWKHLGQQFTPLAMHGDLHDEITGIPKFSLGEECAESKSLLRSPRQKNTGAQKLLRKHHPSSRGQENFSQTDISSFPQYLAPPMNPSLAGANWSMGSTTGSTTGSTIGGKSLDQSLDPSLIEPFERSDSADTDDAGIPNRQLIPEQVLLTKDDTCIQRHRPQLRRTQSAGNVERLIFGWAFPTSIVRIRKTYDKARWLRGDFVNHIDSNVQTYEGLRQKLASHGADITNENRYSDTIKYRISQCTRKEQAVKQQTRNLEAITDKLDYQWTFLLHQVDEVEKSVLMFKKKVDSTAKRWDNIRHMEQAFSWKSWIEERFGLRLGPQ